MSEARRKTLGRVLRLIGIGVAVLCVGFIVLRLGAQWNVIAPNMTAAVLWTAAGCTAFYLASNFLLSFAWYRLLLFCGGKPPNQVMCHVVYGTTLIGKYLPGNVFHFVGRQIVGRRAHMSDSALALSTLLEVGLFSSAAGLLALGAGGTTEFARVGVEEGWIWVVGACLVACILVAPKLVPWAVRKLGFEAEDVELSPHRLLLLLVPLGAYLVFLACSAAVMVVLLSAIRGDGVPVGFVVACYPVVWVVGFLVPGSSGGIGVREALLLLLLAPVLGEPTVLAAAATMRGVTLLGELAFFVVARAIARLVPSARV